MLDGLSVQPPLLSFEFNLAHLESAFRCIDNVLFGSTCEFNFVWGDEGDSTCFELDCWKASEQLKAFLRDMDIRDRHVDVFEKGRPR